MTTDDLVIKEIHDLTIAIKGNKDTRNNVQSEAITKLANALRPGNKFPIQQVSECWPRVQQEQIQQKHEPLTIHPPRVQIYTPPRVRFNLGANEEQSFDANTPPQLIVESSAAKSKHQQQPKPLPILTQPKIVASESIADRVKSRRETQPSLGQTPGQSIAERVAQWRREFASPVLDQDTGKMLEYRQLLRDPKYKAIWSKAGVNEIGRLAQGVGKRIDGTNTIFFVHKHEIPQDRLKDVNYIKFVSSIRTEKEDPHQIRATLGGNLIHYPEDVRTPTANLLLIKIFFNSIILTDEAKFSMADLQLLPHDATQATWIW